MNTALYMYALKLHGYNQSAAAKYLGVSTAAVWQFLQTYSTGRIYIIYESREYYYIDDVTEGKPASGKLTLAALGGTLNKIIAKFPNALFVWPDESKARWHQKTNRWREA